MRKFVGSKKLILTMVAIVVVFGAVSSIGGFMSKPGAKCRACR